MVNKLNFNQGFHDAYYGRPSDPAPHLSTCPSYLQGYDKGSRARPMRTVITTDTGPFTTTCTLAQGIRMMGSL